MLSKCSLTLNFDFGDYLLSFCCGPRGSHPTPTSHPHIPSAFNGMGSDVCHAYINCTEGMANRKIEKKLVYCICPTQLSRRAKSDIDFPGASPVDCFISQYQSTRNT